MSIIAVTEQGTRLSCERERFVLTKGKNRILTVPLHEVEKFLLYGSVEVTSSFIRTVLAKGIDVSFFSGDGKYRGRLQGPDSRNVFVRIKQLERMKEEPFRLGLAMEIVKGKLANQRALLLRHARRGKSGRVSQAAALIQKTLKDLPKAGTLDQVRGHEGAGGAAYFGAFGDLVKNPDFTFSGRNRRPPKDPVNAALSYGYAMLQALVTSMVSTPWWEPSTSPATAGPPWSSTSWKNGAPSWWTPWSSASSTGGN